MSLMYCVQMTPTIMLRVTVLRMRLQCIPICVHLGCFYTGLILCTFVHLAHHTSDDCAHDQPKSVQMTSATADALFQAGYVEYGIPSRLKLQDPVIACYFAAAALQDLASFAGQARSVSFMVQGYISGPKLVCEYWANQEAESSGASQSAPTAVNAQAPPPWEREWANFVKAQKHLLSLSILESQADAELSPMHVVQRDETIASIARVRASSCAELRQFYPAVVWLQLRISILNFAILLLTTPPALQACQRSVPELYKINPDLPATVQCGDCIALPRDCMPRMYRTQRGDTWAGIASWLHMPPARLRARNREAVVCSSGGLLVLQCCIAMTFMFHCVHSAYTPTPCAYPFIVLRVSNSIRNALKLHSLLGSGKGSLLQVLRQGNSFLTSLTHTSVLREGQLLEVPGMGNGTSVCSDDSRVDEPLPAETFVPSPRGAPAPMQFRIPPLVRCRLKAF